MVATRQGASDARPVGRPATGRTTEAVAFRLPLDRHAELVRRAAGYGVDPSHFAQLVIERELRRRPGESERRRIRRQRRETR